MYIAKENHYFSSGMTLVELMVAIGITAILMTLTITVFLSQYTSYMQIRNAHEIQETMPAALGVLQMELMEAGWSVRPEMGFYFEDGGEDASDKIYINDVNVINMDRDTALMEGRQYPGCTLFSGTRSLTLVECPDLDLNGDGTDDFKGRIYQFVITETTDPYTKVAKITHTDPKMGTIKLNKEVSGQFVAPAIYYEIDSASTSLRRSGRTSGGRQPLAENVVDLQVAYRDDEDIWYCDDISSDCPFDPFDPTKIRMIRVTLVMRNDRRDQTLKDISHSKYCRPGVENRMGGDECGYKYRVHSVEFRPRNLAFMDIKF